MALLKTITLPDGTEANYHKINEVRFVHPSAIANNVNTHYDFIIKVYSYASQEARSKGEYNHILTSTVRGYRDAEIVENSNIMAIAYQIVLEDPEFSGAERV